MPVAIMRSHFGERRAFHQIEHSVVLTLGSQGAFVVTAERAGHVPATPIDGPVYPTGAGDTFWVAYLVARADCAAPVDAARRASEKTSAILASGRVR